MERPKTEDERLQMLFDGELSPAEEASMRQSLQSSPAAMTRLREWELVREAMKSASTGWAKNIDSDALFARIEAEISTPVIPIEQVNRVRPSPRAIPGARNRRVWGALATGLAAAAAILLAVWTWPEPNRDASVAGTTVPRGSEVLEADFGSNTGTIFEVEGAAGESLAVVWIEDEQVGLP